MKGKKRTTVSLEEGIIEKARAMMKEEDFGDFSGFLEQIIRERWAKQNEMRETHLQAAMNAENNVNYRKRRKDK